MSNTIRKMYDNDNADISVGIMIDMKAKTETFVIGSSADLILWAESGFSENQTGSLIRHTNEIGSIIKNINKLIRFSREADTFLADYERASNIEVYCAENYNAVLESIANNYEYGNHVNMFLNLIVMNTYARCICERRKYNDPKNLLKGRGFLLKEAEKRNLSLLQARLSQDLAREQIRQAQDGHLPTLDLTASTGISDTSYSGSKTRGAAGTQYDDSNMGQNKVGLSFSLPIYQGGMVNSQVKQAQYNFVGASEQLESAHRSVVQTVRSSFNNINASISSINAYKQAVVSAQSSLDAMEAGYSVGTPGTSRSANIRTHYHQ